jgi:hypothetical protein
MHNMRRENSIFYKLSQFGYSTGLFTSNEYVRSHNLNSGFNHITGIPDSFDKCFSRGKVTSSDTPDGFYYAQEFSEWKDEKDNWAACINLMDAHSPYEPRPEFDSSGSKVRSIQERVNKHRTWRYHGGEIEDWEIRSLYSLYLDCIRQVDRILQKILSEVSEDTLVVVTSDHGEGFVDSSPIPKLADLVSHGSGVQEELLHVPLIVQSPNQDEENKITSLASLCEFPSAVDTLGTKELDNGEFCVDECYAGRVKLMNDVREIASQYVDDVERVSTNAKVFYEDFGKGKVKKKAAWNNEVCEMVSAGPSAVTKSEVVDSSTIQEYDMVEKRDDILIERDGLELGGDLGNDDELKERLEDLGYL